MSLRGYNDVVRWVEQGRYKTYRKFKGSRTWRLISDDYVQLELHGNAIGRYYANGTIEISLAGWNTPTTRKTLSDEMGIHVYTLKGDPYLHRWRIPTSKWVRVRYNGAPILTPEGKPIHFIPIIKQKKRMDEVRRIIKERLSAVVEARKSARLLGCREGRNQIASYAIGALLAGTPMDEVPPRQMAALLELPQTWFNTYVAMNADAYTSFYYERDGDKEPYKVEHDPLRY
jgi:hypothetical protein